MTTFQRRAELALLGTAAAASFALAISVALPAFGADLSGTGAIADLEERIAEIESSVARKGNRKVSVTISGHLSRSILFVQGGGYTGSADNPNSPSRVGISGDGKISPNVKVGYLYEFGFNPLTIDPPGPFPPVAAVNTISAQTESLLVTRHAALWIEGPMGKGTMGFTSDAADGISEITTTNRNVAGLTILGLDGARANVVRYDTPSLGGLTGSISYAQERTSITLAPLNPVPKLTGDTVAMALRYAGELGGFRLGAGLGYWKEIETHTLAAPTTALPWTVAGSGSILHVGTGLFADAAAGQTQGGNLRYHLAAGIERNWTGWGNTTFYGEYANAGSKQTFASAWGLDLTGGKIDRMYGLGLVQTIDSAATDLFVTVRRFDGVGEGTAGMVGARVRF
jgi:hypothetical protein